MEVHQNSVEPWQVTLIDTGEATMTGGRLKRVRQYLDDEDFCFTYGDGVSDINITDLLKFHRTHGNLATLTGVQPPGRFGSLKLKGTKVSSFEEKPYGDGGWINGGFFVVEPEFLNLIGNKNVMLERTPLKKAVKTKNLAAFKHAGFWFCMDTLRDKKVLDALIKNKKSPWLK